MRLASPRDSARILATLRAGSRAIAVFSGAQLRFGVDTADDCDHPIIDPCSGRTPPYLSAAVVAAGSAALADARTKLMFMAPPAQALVQARRCGIDVVAANKAGRLQASGG